MDTIEIIEIGVVGFSLLISFICFYYTFKTKRRYERLALRLGNNTDISVMLKSYIDKVNEIACYIVELCKEPLCFEHILQKLFTYYNLKMNFEQYVLVDSTIRSYLTWLKDKRRLDNCFQDNMLLWKQTG